METNNINVHKVSVYKPDSPIKQKYNILSNEEVCKNTTALINEKNKKWQDFLNKYKEESLHYLIQIDPDILTRRLLANSEIAKINM